MLALGPEYDHLARTIGGGALPWEKHSGKGENRGYLPLLRSFVKGIFGLPETRWGGRLPILDQYEECRSYIDQEIVGPKREKTFGAVHQAPSFGLTGAGWLDTVRLLI